MPAKHFIAGTAGHIDHGKTSLVKALTGFDTDRLKEEKERGITIDLGFASSTFLNDITLSWIDVPGHERFIGNMLAGVAGIDFVVLVVAATEGVMPQTREHFEICRMLGVSRGLIALTKADLVDEMGLELAKADVQALIAGSFLADAPMLAVSSRTGLGIAELRQAIGALLESMEMRPAGGSFRLPIDRAFVMKGFGTVVTGTIFNGEVAPEQIVTLVPAGKPVRVRGVQVHGQSVSVAVRGQRAALNLAGIETAEIERGNALVDSQAYRQTNEFDVVLEMLSTAPELPPRHPVHFHMGTMNTVAHLRFHDRLPVARPGSRVFARVLTEAPVVALPGDHFILRRFSPLETIGGGVILDNQPPRLRRKQSESERLTTLATGNPALAMGIFAREAAAGCELLSLIPRLGMRESELRELAARSNLRLCGAQRDWLMSAEQLEANAERIQSTLTQFHSRQPILPGMPKEQLRAALRFPWPDAVFDWLLVHDGRFAREGDVVRLSVHQPRLSAPEEKASRRMEDLFLNAGLEVPPVNEVIESTGIDQKLSTTILHRLIREGRLVKVGQDLIFHKQNLGRLVGELQKRRGQRFTVSEFKEWTTVSRKFAIPLLEFLDRQRITRRDGDQRTIL